METRRSRFALRRFRKPRKSLLRTTGLAVPAGPAHIEAPLSQWVTRNGHRIIFDAHRCVRCNSLSAMHLNARWPCCSSASTGPKTSERRRRTNLRGAKRVKDCESVLRTAFNQFQRERDIRSLRRNVRTTIPTFWHDDASVLELR